MAESDSPKDGKTMSNGAGQPSNGQAVKDKTSMASHKKLSADAPVFDVSRSPTLDPYTGPHAIHTQPAYVPPAQIPPPAQPQQAPAQQAAAAQNGQTQNAPPTQATQHQSQQQQQAQHQQNQQRHPNRSSQQSRDKAYYGQQQQGQAQQQTQPPQQQPPYDPQFNEDPRRPNPNAMYPGYKQPMQPQMRPPHGQYPKYPGPNYPQYPMNRNPGQAPYGDPNHFAQHPRQPMINPRNGRAYDPYYMAMRDQQYPNGAQYGPPPTHQPPNGANGGSSSQQPSVNGTSPQQNGPPTTTNPANGPSSNGAVVANGATSPEKNGASTTSATQPQQPQQPPKQQQPQPPSQGGGGGPAQPNESNTAQPTAPTAGGQQQQQANPANPATTGQPKVQFTTFTKQKNARAVGPTMAYKHPSRSHYGQPKPELRDPKFTNPANLLHLQRWELLESAKRWLPGEGTIITWKNYRYLIGPPIHMGMNGHIHYCYKYPIPPHKREKINKEEANKKKKRKKNNTKDNKSKSLNDEDDDDEQEENENDEQEIQEIDINSPCVETLAAKIVPNTPAFAREIVILRALQDCENVTELYDVLESDRTLISILELAQADVYNFFVGRGSTRHGWNLDKPAVREHFSKMVISNVVQGLDQMHKAQYLHCDLKSLNILLYIYVTDHSNRRGGVYIKAKLTDFGHSSHGTTRMAEKLFSNGMARVGTAGHVAPELFKEGTRCTEKIDIWSLGIVMFSMLVPGRLLFSEYTNLDTLKQKYDRLNKMNPWSRDRPSWWTDFERLSPEARDLILWMTRFEAHHRPTCQEILKHPWFLIGKAGHREHYRPKLKYVDMLCSSSIAQE